ncbi:TetR/AcrR family transcriptional regulator [Kitasatospora sp. NPDC001574]
MDQLVRRQAAARSTGRAVERPVERPVERSTEAASGPCPVRIAAEVLRRPVRRRGKELETAIFDATLDQLTSGGFARLTMEGVAQAARTGKAALYRRWASKVELVIDALDSTLPRPSDTPDLGSAREELLYLVESFAAVVHSRSGGAMHALMAELDHEQAALFKDFMAQRVIEPTKGVILDILRRGAERGDVRPGAVTSMVADLAPAMLLYRVKICGGQVGPEFATELVDEVMVPLMRN